jgi:N-acetylmuramoyl-L-alanine amidase
LKIASGWVDTAIGIYYPNKSMSRNGYKPTHICLHGTAGGTSAQDIANYFLTSTVQASSHFIIGVDGTIVQGLSMDVAAWGNGILDQPRLPWPVNINPNYYTISIEHCKASADNSDALTPAQQQSSFQLINVICDTYGIVKRTGDVQSGIVSHADFDSVSRARCPGTYPWNDLWSYLTGGLPMAGIPQGWKDDGTTLTAPNGHKVVAGFRNYILNPINTWRADDLPLEEEHAATPLEISNPSLGTGHVQHFNYSILEWTPTKGVFLAYAGKEAMALRAALKV